MCTVMLLINKGLTGASLKIPTSWERNDTRADPLLPERAR